MILARLLLIPLLSAISSVAQATDLKNTLSAMTILTAKYGNTVLRVEGRKVWLSRGYFNLVTAWGGDIYTSMVQDPSLHVDQEPDLPEWKIVRYGESPWNNFLTRTLPHTEEDSISTVRFLVPRGESLQRKRFSALYFLRAERDYLPNLSHIPGHEERSTRAHFKFYKLGRDDFGIFRLIKVRSEWSRHRYCNVELALNRELGIAFPGNDSDGYLCN